MSSSSLNGLKTRRGRRGALPPQSISSSGLPETMGVMIAMLVAIELRTLTLKIKTIILKTMTSPTWDRELMAPASAMSSSWNAFGPMVWTSTLTRPDPTSGSRTVLHHMRHCRGATICMAVRYLPLHLVVIRTARIEEVKRLQTQPMGHMQAGKYPNLGR